MRQGARESMIRVVASSSRESVHCTQMAAGGGDARTTARGGARARSTTNQNNKRTSLRWKLRSFTSTQTMSPMPELTPQSRPETNESKLSLPPGGVGMAGD